MKRFSKLVCLILVMATILAVPVYAQEIQPYGSDFFGSKLSYLYKTSSTEFEVWIEVIAIGMMDEIGASSITVQRSSDDKNWTDVKTYTKSTDTNLVCTNSYHHEAYVTYTGTSGYYYRAKVWFYAKKGTDTAEYSYTTASVLL